MSSRKRVQGHQGTLAFSKCKRIIRPLLSKIHGLHDLNCKYPSLVEFQLPLNELRSKTNETTGNSTYGSSRPSSRSDSSRHKRLKLSKSYDKNDGSESDSNYELTFILPSSSPPPQKPHEKTFSNKIDDLVNCTSSSDRMKALGPFISKELYHSYEEIFQVFKNIITTVVIERQDSHISGNVPKLSSICSFKIGKSIALSTKTTYHKLSHSLLFDSESIPANLQKLNQDLNDDVDSWFEMEPEMFSRAYRDDFLIGYVIHLLIFNSGSILYNLIPVLVHWLYEESQSRHVPKLAEIGRTMFTEYWKFSETYYDEIDSELVTNQNHTFNTIQNFRTFWVFYKIGYWEKFIDFLNIRRSERETSYFDLLMLDTLSLSKKLDLDGLSQLDIELQNHNFLKNDIYDLIKRNPQHPQVNNILISIITHIILRIRSNFKLIQRTNEMRDYLKTSYDDIFYFISVWLSFTHENSVVFNSLYPGNEVMFKAIIKIISYLEGKCTLMIKKISTYLEELHPSYSKNDYLYYKNSKDEFLEYREQFSTINQAIVLLRSYYLDIHDSNLASIRIKSVSRVIIELQKHASSRGKYNFPDFNNFIIWLYESNLNDLLLLAQRCFQSFYGTSKYFKHDGIDYLHQLLFE